MPKRSAVAKCLLISGVVVFIIIVVVIAFYFSLRNYAKDEGTHPDGLTFFPNDTRVFFRPTLCQKLNLNVAKNSYPYSASITVLKSAPSLSKQPSFNLVTQPANSSGWYVDYQFHFYPGSEVSVSACKLEATSSKETFYFMIDSDFNKFKKSRSSKVKTKFDLSQDCQSRQNYSASKGGRYHLVFSTSANSLSRINASLTITQFQYSPSQSEILSNCSIINNGKSCTADVPVSATSTLLSYMSHNTTTWALNENMLALTCTPRVWLILVISLGATFIIIVSILLTVAILSAIIACRKKYEPSKDPSLVGYKTPLVQ